MGMAEPFTRSWLRVETCSNYLYFSMVKFPQISYVRLAHAMNSQGAQSTILAAVSQPQRSAIQPILKHFTHLHSTNNVHSFFFNNNSLQLWNLQLGQVGLGSARQRSPVLTLSLAGLQQLRWYHLVAPDIHADTCELSGLSRLSNLRPWSTLRQSQMYTATQANIQKCIATKQKQSNTQQHTATQPSLDRKINICMMFQHRSHLEHWHC